MHEEMETLTRTEIEALQFERLLRTLRRCMKSPFYQKRFAEHHLSPSDIHSLDDLRKIPFTTKQDLRDNYPFGLAAVPMSEVAGRLGMLNGAYYLQKTKGGRGLLACGVPGVEPAHVLVLGGGIVGQAAARVAAGLGATVTIADISLPKLRELSLSMPANVTTLFSSRHNIERELARADVVVGAVLVPGDKAPHLVTRDMLHIMRPGSVLVDVAIDQGGCFETSHPTTHSDPVYEVDGILHYAVANIPGAVPYTSTSALTNATLRYAIALADKGWQRACRDDAALRLGLNVVEGKVTYRAVADVFSMPWQPVEI